MRAEVAASLFDHRAFLAKLRRRPGLISSASPSEVQAALRMVLGNIEDLKDYHSETILPRLQGAISNEELIKLVQ